MDVVEEKNVNTRLWKSHSTKTQKTQNVKEKLGNVDN